MIVLLDNLRSIYNVGSIFRTADAFGIEKLYLCGTTPHPHPNEPWRKDHLALAKTALGAELTVPWEYCATTLHILEELKTRSVKLLALETHDDAVDILKITPPAEPFALVLGNEVDGVSEEVLKKCDGIISIPMRGHKESLNVAVAFGIAAAALTQK